MYAILTLLLVITICWPAYRGHVKLVEDEFAEQRANLRCKKELRDIELHRPDHLVS
jgi:hypothetical protein